MVRPLLNRQAFYILGNSCETMNLADARLTDKKSDYISSLSPCNRSARIAAALPDLRGSLPEIGSDSELTAGSNLDTSVSLYSIGYLTSIRAEELHGPQQGQGTKEYRQCTTLQSRGDTTAISRVSHTHAIS